MKALHKFKTLNSTKNSEELAQVIQIDSAYTNCVLDDVWKEDGSWDALETHTPKTLWDEISSAHFRAGAEFRLGNYVQAYKHHLDSYNAFLRAFQKMSRWGVHALFVMCSDLYKVAKRADRQLRMAGEQETKLEDATRAINQGFSVCMTDREPLLSKSRKWGTYRLANLLFALYLRLKAYNLCTSMIRAINASELPSLDRFPMSDQVTFRYYRGILAFRSEKYAAAKDDLVFALEHCHRNAYHNRMQILIHLTPLLMMGGTMPKPWLLRKHAPINDLYGDISAAIKRGDLREFDRLVSARERHLVALGTFLAIEHSRKIAIRQLLYKTYLIGGKGSRIPLSQFQAAAAAAWRPTGAAETECILADMIFRGFVKGYLAHEHATVVLSKQDPFPPLSSLSNPGT
ncbi:hypothetical protein GQ54DRAFT_262339 [Martensiomyces pterosporus]|nr:hypothetical protein GQ54DRAFT_262339 [Martensiomyces pterosporus]